MKKAFGLLATLCVVLAAGCHGSSSADSSSTPPDMGGDQSSASVHINRKPMSIKGTPQATREGNEGAAGAKVGK